MKRLFQVNTSPVSFFDNKVDAKKARGERQADKDQRLVYPFKVSKGPDHIGNHGQPVMSTRHRAPQVLKPKREEPRVRKSAKK